MRRRSYFNSKNENLTNQIKKSGAINELQAHFLSQVGVSVVKHHINQLKTYTGPPKSKAQKIAAFLIVKYLTKHKMLSTLECAKYETLKGLFIKQDLTACLQCEENSNIISFLIQDRLMNFNPALITKSSIFSSLSSHSSLVYAYKAKSF